MMAFEEQLQQIKDSKSPEILDLSGQEIDDAKAEALAEALRENKSTNKLDLSNNNITDTGATALLNALRNPEKATENVNDHIIEIKLDESVDENIRQAIDARTEHNRQERVDKLSEKRKELVEEKKETLKEIIGNLKQQQDNTNKMIGKTEEMTEKVEAQTKVVVQKGEQRKGRASSMSNG